MELELFIQIRFPLFSNHFNSSVEFARPHERVVPIRVSPLPVFSARFLLDCRTAPVCCFQTLPILRKSNRVVPGGAAQDKVILAGSAKRLWRFAGFVAQYRTH